MEGNGYEGEMSKAWFGLDLADARDDEETIYAFGAKRGRWRGVYDRYGVRGRCDKDRRRRARKALMQREDVEGMVG